MRVDRPVGPSAVLVGLRPPAARPAPPGSSRPSRPSRRPTGLERPTTGGAAPRPAARRPARRPGPAGGDGADLRIDPRIAARRDAVRHVQGRRRARRIAVFAGAVAAVAAAAGATRSPLLDLDRIEVAGAARTPTEVVLATATDAGLVPGTAMTELELGAARVALADLPWVRTASVQREWPGTVRIQLEERVAVATVPTPAGVVLVAGDGTVLEVVATAADGLVTLAEVPAPPRPGGEVDDATLSLLAVAAELPPALRPSVAAVAPGADGGVDLVLGPGSGAPDGVRVALGTATDPASAFVAVVTVLEQVDLTCLATIDVRVPSAPVLTRSPLCS